MQCNRTALVLVFAASVLTVVWGLVMPARASFDTVESWSNPPSTDGWPEPGGQYPLYNGGADGGGYMNDGGYLGVRTDDYPNGSVWGVGLPSTYDGSWATKFGTTGNVEFDLKVWGGTNATPDGNAPDGRPWGYDLGGHVYASIAAEATPSASNLGSYFLLYTANYYGWRHTLQDQGPAANVVHYSFPFNANWTDAEAEANGWVPGQYGNAFGGWAATVASIDAAKSGWRFIARGYSMHLALDNFRPGPEFIAGLPGDLNHDGVVDAADIDLLGSQIRSGSTDLAYDLNGDSSVNSDDLSYMVQTILGTYFGDTNLDKKVDVIDLGNLATAWQTVEGWALGDGNADLFIDVVDLGLLATNWQAGVSGPAGAGSLQEALASFGLPSAGVPEPGSAVLGIGTGMGMMTRRRRSGGLFSRCINS